MAKRAELSPYLPPKPLTAEQHVLFDEHVRLAYKLAHSALRRWGGDHKDVVREGALIGLMCAAARYQTPSEASFVTFASRTINWTIRLILLNELGVRERKRKSTSYEPPPFDLSDTCACDATPDCFVDHEHGVLTVIDRRTPEFLLIEAERQQELKSVVGNAMNLNPPRSTAMLERHMEGEPLARIAVDYGVSRERARQIVSKAKALIGQHARSVA